MEEAATLKLLSGTFDEPVAEYLCSILATQEKWSTAELIELMTPFQGDDGGEDDLAELCSKLSLSDVEGGSAAVAERESLFKEGDECRVLSVGGTHGMSWHDATIKSIRVVPPNIRLFQVRSALLAVSY